MISLYGLAAGLLWGWSRGGRLGALAAIRLRLWGLCLAGLALHRLLPLAVPALRGGMLGHVIDAGVFYAALAGFALANRDRPGAYALVAGAVANAIPTLLAGGRMPVWVATLARIPARATGALMAGRDVSHVAMAHPAGLLWLGDVLATPPPLPPDVISIGDIAIAAGVAVFLAASMAPSRPADASAAS